MGVEHLPGLPKGEWQARKGWERGLSNLTLLSLPCALQDTHQRLEQDAEAAHKAGLAFGVKLVRGAYLDKERSVAQHQGKEDCTQPDYEATSRR